MLIWPARLWQTQFGQSDGKGLTGDDTDEVKLWWKCVMSFSTGDQKKIHIKQNGQQTLGLKLLDLLLNSVHKNTFYKNTKIHQFQEM